MSAQSGTGTVSASRVAVAVCLGLIACSATAQSITGTATVRERMALPPEAVFEATLEDVSRADAPAATIGSARVDSPGNPPTAFTIPHDPARILASHRYVVRASILLEGKPLFTTDTAAPVLTAGHPTTVSLMLRWVGAGSSPAPAPQSPAPLVGTHWQAIELVGKPIPKQDAQREAHLVFQEGGRTSGSDGCNRVLGSYELQGEALAFGQMAGTQMACMDTGEIETAFHEAMKRAARLKIAGDRLELFDAAGMRVAAFAARVQDGSAGLEGTSWQLVKFQGSDDTTLLPDERLKYTIEFGSSGRLTARIDCNRGMGTWNSPEPSLLEFGPLALTRAQCPPGSLHDRIVKHWPYIRSYVIRDGHLFLALMADGGIYEFEPRPAQLPTPSSQLPKNN